MQLVNRGLQRAPVVVRSLRELGIGQACDVVFVGPIVRSGLAYPESLHREVVDVAGEERAQRIGWCLDDRFAGDVEARVEQHWLTASARDELIDDVTEEG